MRPSRAAILRDAAAAHVAGRLEDAAALFRSALSLDFADAQALCGLAAIEAQRGRLQTAADLIDRAVRAAPSSGVPHVLRANVLQAMGLPQDAAVALLRASELDPRLPICFRLCDLLIPLGRSADAAAALRRCADAAPNDPSVHLALGVALQAAGQLAAAVEAYRRAIAIDDSDFEAHSNLSVALSALGKAQDATDHARRAVALRPDLPEAHNCLGNALAAAEKHDEAIRAFEASIALASNPHAYANLASELRHVGRLEAAEAAARRAVALDPNNGDSRLNLASTLLDLWRVEESVVEYRRAVASAPQSAVVHSALILALHYAVDEPQALFEAHRQWRAAHAPGPPVPRRPAPAPGRDRRLRVGYVSPDFRLHAVSFFIEPLLAHHDRTAVEVFCYSDAALPDEVTARLRRYADHWRDVHGLATDEFCGLVAADGIDVLVDLASHTAGNRLPAFVRRPAPVQVTYLAYCDTTGSGAIDYRLTDQWIDPPGMTERFQSETLLRVPGGFCCYQPPAAAPDVETSPPAAARAGRITFGSFNQVPKITPARLASWAAILNAVPDSTLVMQARGIDQPAVRAALLRALESHGVAADRVRTIPTQPLAEHLLTMGQVDIALDTYPFAGHTTTCHALWMGVPTVTRAGVVPVSRVGTSLLHHVGLDDLATDCESSYIAAAVQLAADSHRRADLRRTLRPALRRSPLLDASRLAREVEALFRAAGAGSIPHGSRDDKSLT